MGVTGVPVHLLIESDGGLLFLFVKLFHFYSNLRPLIQVGENVLVIGMINLNPLALLNMYAPNFDSPDFFCKVFNLVAECNDCNIITGRDFNCYFDPVLDRSSSKVALPLKSVPVLIKLVNSLNVVHIWRHQHPLKRQFSFFSLVHGSFTKTDYFLVDSKLIPDVFSSTYHSISISDHAPGYC